MPRLRPELLELVRSSKSEIVLHHPRLPFFYIYLSHIKLDKSSTQTPLNRKFMYILAQNSQITRGRTKKQASNAFAASRGCIPSQASNASTQNAKSTYSYHSIHCLTDPSCARRRLEQVLIVDAFLFRHRSPCLQCIRVDVLLLSKGIPKGREAKSRVEHRLCQHCDRNHRTLQDDKFHLLLHEFTAPTA